MKDLYSWHKDQQDFETFYQKAKQAYLKVFKRMGLEAKATEASGGAFTEKLSYEFEVLTDAGEARILYCDSCDYCVNIDDIKTYQEGDLCPSCKKNKLQPAKAAEVGNVFDLGQKYTKAFELTILGENGEKVYPIMGCYGIGISRTMGVLVERFHDDKGIIWPKEVAPFQIHLLQIGSDKKVEQAALKLYQKLNDKGVEVLYDDRIDKTAGEKFMDADLIGIPLRVVVSERSLAENSFELKQRESQKTELVKTVKILSKLKSLKIL